MDQPHQHQQPPTTICQSHQHRPRTIDPPIAQPHQSLSTTPPLTNHPINHLNYQHLTQSHPPNRPNPTATNVTNCTSPILPYRFQSSPDQIVEFHRIVTNHRTTYCSCAGRFPDRPSFRRLAVFFELAGTSSPPALSGFGPDRANRQLPPQRKLHRSERKNAFISASSCPNSPPIAPVTVRTITAQGISRSG